MIIDYQKPHDLLGVDIIELDLERVIQVAQDFDQAQIAQGIQDLTNQAVSINQGGQNALQKTVRVQLAIQTLAEEQNIAAVALSCWPQFQSDYGLAVCSVMGQLNTDGLIAACEGDLTSAISMLTLRYLTDGDVVTLMDLVTVDESDESVLLWHCGPTSPALADEKGTTMGPLWLFDGPKGEETGLHNNLVLKPGAGTILGFSTDFTNMLVLNGEINNTKPSYMGSRGWFKDITLNGLRIDTPDLMQTLLVSGYQHHYPFAYGNLTNACLEICGWLRINPIARENYTPYVR